MRDFEYAAPETVAEAVALLAEGNGRARVLAGGTDLIDHLRTERIEADLVVDVKRVPDLNALQLSPAGLRLGAAVPCYRVTSDQDVASAYPALADACSIVGGVQIQSRASVGGNLCNSGPAADTIPALIALGARAEIAGPAGERVVPVERFCTGPGRNVLERGELLVAITIPRPPAGSGSFYTRFIPRNEMDIAVVGVGVSVQLNEALDRIVAGRIALGAVAPTPLFAESASAMLAGGVIDEAFGARVAAACQEVISPIDDMRGTKEFRRHITGVLVRRSLGAAIERARRVAQS